MKEGKRKEDVHIGLRSMEGGRSEEVGEKDEGKRKRKREGQRRRKEEGMRT
jgi:hypothetical protein